MGELSSPAVQATLGRAARLFEEIAPLVDGTDSISVAAVLQSIGLCLGQWVKEARVGDEFPEALPLSDEEVSRQLISGFRLGVFLVRFGRAASRPVPANEEDHWPAGEEEEEEEETDAPEEDVHAPSESDSS